MIAKQKKKKKRKLKKAVKYFLWFGGIACVLICACVLVMRRSLKEETVISRESAFPTESVSPTSTPEVYTAKLFMTGDALIHGAVYTDALQADGSYDFHDMVEEVGELSKGYDLKFYNQETLLGGTELGLSHYPQFNSPQEVGDAMVDMGFNLVSTATNHTLDQGIRGIESSCAYWKKQEEKGVHMAGSYASKEDAESIPVYEVNGITYTFLSWTYGLNGLELPEGYEYAVNVYTGHEEEMLQQVRDAKAISDVVIIAMHWGTEYVSEPNEEEVRLAQELADAGATIIIGNHPHVIQPMQWLNNHSSVVFYALGNMISAQLETFNLTGLVAGVTITKTVDESGTTITLSNGCADLIYTYMDSDYRNFHVYPYDALTDEILMGHEEYYAEWVKYITSMDSDFSVGVRLQ